MWTSHDNNDKKQNNLNNDAWIRGETANAVSALMETNLQHANEVALPVHPAGGWYVNYGKRILDIILSCAALMVALPIIVFLGILTYFDVGSPIIFRQKRTGKNLKSFELIKFRNMTNECDDTGELLPPEERITKFGLFVRQYSIDELLNFWSVLKGDMSIIGPRPLPVEYTIRMTERHKMRYAVRPGLENPFINLSLWNGYDYSHARFENDIQYIETVSFRTDIMQMFRLFAMVFGKRRLTGSTGTDSHFIGYDSDGLAMSQDRLKNEQCHKSKILSE